MKKGILVESGAQVIRPESRLDDRHRAFLRIAIDDDRRADRPDPDRFSTNCSISFSTVYGGYQAHRLTRRTRLAGVRRAQTGHFNPSTFEVRAYPVTPFPGLRPGMGVYAEWPTVDGR